jgi:hypothetical protein
VRSALGRGRAARRQLLGRASVRGEPPAGAQRLVDGLAHDWVAELEAARHGRRPHEVRRQQVVERIERIAGRGARDRRGEVELERLTGHRRCVEQAACGRRQGVELLGKRRDDRVGHAAQREPVTSVRRRHGRPGARELFEVERHACAAADDRGGRVAVDAREKLGGLGLVQRGEHVTRARVRRERRDQRLGRLARPEADRKQHGRAQVAAQQRAEQLERRVVGPLQVVEHEQQRLVVGQRRQQRAHGPVHAVALVGDHRAVTVAGMQRRQDAPELVRHVAGECEVLRRDVVVQRVDPHPVWEAALELGAGAGEHQVAITGRALAQLAQQARLADAGLAFEGDEAALAVREATQCGVQRPKLYLPADNRPRVREHVHGCDRAYVNLRDRFRGCPGCSGGRQSAGCDV